MIKSKRVVMARQDTHIRIRNFDEVTLGYTAEQAIREASRCYGCKKPKCTEGCPVDVSIPEFVEHVKNGNFEDAYNTLTNSLLFPRITGRVCPQETQCEGFCVAGVKKGCDSLAIGNLERFVGDWAADKGIIPPYEIRENGKSVAIIGSGPAGITAATDLRKKGYNVTLYEALHIPGGVLVYGIPEFRLPKAIVRNEIRKLVRMGVEIKYNTLIGATKSFEDLKEENDAIFIGTGAGLPRFLGIPGEELVGVYTANEFLARINLMGANKFPQFSTPIDIGDKVAVVGGGNVAMDSARVALRLGAKVDLFYRRTRECMPARKVEVHHALEEGVNFRELRNPIRLIDGDGRLQRIKYSVMKLSDDLDNSGRRIPVESGRSYSSPYDTLIIAIGQRPNPLLPRKVPYLNTDERGHIVVNPKTLRVESIDDCLVFAGGDIVGNQHNGRGGTVIDAMGHGRLAAKNIDKLMSARETMWKKKKIVLMTR
ncbi:MAG: NADPH-dependent glutamate synthase [Candidatus Bathyarchaeota archaeon]|nr:NADPH-dependent glutamate synthase [Candidatus Bathyarchaeota archaeon]